MTRDRVSALEVSRWLSRVILQYLVSYEAAPCLLASPGNPLAIVPRDNTESDMLAKLRIESRRELPNFVD